MNHYYGKASLLIHWIIFYSVHLYTVTTKATWQEVEHKTNTAEYDITSLTSNAWCIHNDASAGNESFVTCTSSDTLQSLLRKTTDTERHFNKLTEKWFTTTRYK